jgi:hypothetical protein
LDLGIKLNPDYRAIYIAEAIKKQGLDIKIKNGGRGETGGNEIILFV